MSVGVLRRCAVPAAVALPIALAGLVAGTGDLPSPFRPGADGTVTAVPSGHGLGIPDTPHDPRVPDPADLTGAHPVTFPVGTSAVRLAVAREVRPAPDTSDLALPTRVLAAYRAAARDLRRSDSSCHLDWSLLAGIGKVESGHAYGGEVDRHGDTLEPILGPVLDGSPGVAAIPDTDDGRWDTDETWDRAVGPMQFIPSTWAVHGEDGNHDGRRDPNNVNDASLASGSYLCAGGRDVSQRKQRRAAVYSYNHSWDYVDLVLAWADAYAGGTPVLTGSLAFAVDEPAPGGRDGSPGTGATGGAGSATGVAATSPPPSAAPVDGGTATPGADTTTAPAGDPTSAAPTPTVSAAATPTPTATRSPDPCPTGTGTPSPDGSGTPSPDGSATTATATPTPTESATPEPTGTASGSPEPTPTCP